MLEMSQSDRCDGIDMLSNLPEHIVYHIFSFLDTMDVIRLRVVSKKLSYLCASVPYMNFDSNGICTRPWSYYDPEVFKDYVNWVLLSLDPRTNIYRLRISCPNEYDDSVVARWIYVAVERNVRELDLYMSQWHPFQLPLCVVACESLVALKLELNYAVLKLPAYNGFSRLKYFKLKNIKFTDEELWTKVFSSCPVLENLTLDRCDISGLSVLDICARNLKTLAMDITYFMNLVTELRIDCPNLVSIDLDGTPVGKFLLKNPLSLNSLSIHIEDYFGERYVSGETMSSYIKAIVRTKVLKLNYNLLKRLCPELAKPSSISSFYGLKSLKLLATNVKSYMQTFIQFLKCSPVLETLQLIFDEVEEEQALSKIQYEPIVCLSYHLKEIVVNNYNGSSANSFEVVRFLLKYGLVLEKMAIKVSRWIDLDEAIKEVTSFHKSSSYVQFIISESNGSSDWI